MSSTLPPPAVEAIERGVMEGGGLSLCGGRMSEFPVLAKAMRQLVPGMLILSKEFGGIVDV
ncbi:MAG: hypothetical protein LBG27_04875 [Spirochaetaceae bacterium]|nr:hypothetical protein [Spirochaetaceae bacterium]